MHNLQVLRRQRAIESVGSDVASSPMCILVLDADSKIIGQLENALWVWPHKLTLAADLEGAVRLCQHLTPAAILVAVDSGEDSETRLIPALRRHLPTVPIVAVVSRMQFVTPGKFLDQGADTLLMREDADRPMLHDLLLSVQRNPDAVKTATQNQVTELTLPWRRSEMIGALICDVSGSIVDANRVLAKWLGYPNTAELRGRNVPHNLLTNPDDWEMWTQVAGDKSASFHQVASVAARNAQILYMQVEVFAAPNHPNYMQVAFVEQTDSSMLTGLER